MNGQYIVSYAPHIRSKESTKKIMWLVVLALLPTGAAGAWIFGINSIYVIAASILTAVVVEAVLQKLTKKPVSISDPECSKLLGLNFGIPKNFLKNCSIRDGSAVITGLLLAYNLPAGAPLWLAAAGAFFAIAVAKHTFGGLGKNIFNPALAGRAFLMASWPGHMTRWVNPRFWPDGISSATPLAKIVTSHQSPVTSFSYWDLLIGNRGGCIGEVCVLAILLGAAFLLYKGYIRPHTPFTYIFTLGILTWLFGGSELFCGDWIFAILAGGVMLGAFFMATDMVTTPLTAKGQLIFGFGCGILTFVIRKYSGYPEGVSYSILIMNAATPMIDRFTQPIVFGRRKPK